MTEIPIRNKVLNSIVEIKNKKDNSSIPIKSKELKFESSKYSSVKNEIWHVFINGEKIKKTSDILIYYKCLTCDKPNSCASTQFLRKIRKGKTKCPQCHIIDLYQQRFEPAPLRGAMVQTVTGNLVEDSSAMRIEIFNGVNDRDRTQQATTKPSQLISVENTKKSYQELYEISKQEFETYPDQYRNSYLLSHLSIDDYNRIKPNIISFCNGKNVDINNYEYWSIYKVNNQMKFSYVFHDKINDSIFKAHQPIIKCDNCEKPWRCKSLETFKNCYKILCHDCKLCNRIFKLRPMKNINNEIIMYQSKLELKFIEWCASNNIIVKNGPNIDYTFKDKQHKYRVDFEIDGFLIEIKDFHIWHRNQVESGKWDEKVNAANKFINDNKGYKKYYFITPNNWIQKLKELELELQKNKTNNNTKN
jgi:hypothetical protein